MPEPEPETTAPPAPAAKTPFDPTPFITTVGGNDYLDVKWRLLWFRKEFPDGVIETHHVVLEPAAAIFKARVVKRVVVDRETGEFRELGFATGYGSETAADFADFIEKAETKAIGRALAALGFGVQFCPDFDGSTRARGQAARGGTSRNSRTKTQEGPATEQIAADPTTWKGSLAFWRDEVDQADTADALLDVSARLMKVKQPPQMVIDYLEKKRESLGLPPVATGG